MSLHVILVVVGSIIIGIKSHNIEETKSDNEISAKPADESSSSFWNLVAVQENFYYLISPEVPKNAMTSLYGMRAISMLWVM